MDERTDGTTHLVPRMFIGILTYNGLHHTQRCVESLIAHTQGPWTALILDNASSDATPDYLRSLNDERISVHCGGENLGVGGGRNWLLEQLTASLHDDDLIVLLDNDIEVAAGWERPFLDAFAARANLGIAGRWAFSMLVHDTWRDILPEDSADSGPVDTVQGCCVFIRASTARAVGGFDTSLGRFWHEDDDYSIRALHAGWDVRRVWTDAITHHEHGSGVALNPDKLCGSRKNQEYLAAKWRALGAIDEHGVPRRPCGESERASREQLALRIGRPLVRTEVNSAMMGVTRMLHAELTDDELGALATPVARLLLQEMTAVGGATASLAQRADARLQALLGRRRETAPIGEAATRAFSGLCNPDAWDDRRWASGYERAFLDGSTRDYTSRTESAWRDGQLLHALRTLGVLRRDTAVLMVGGAGERLVAALSALVSDLHIADAANTPSKRFAVVICPNLGRFATAGEVPALLGALAGCAEKGGLVAVAGSVRISGPRDSRWLECELFRDATRLAEHGLSRVGAFDGHVRDELLIRACPARSSLSLRPGVSRCVESSVVTLATLVARAS